IDKPLSLDRVFAFPEDELEPHPAYDFFVPAPLPGYAGNLNNNNEWLATGDYLLGELEAMVDEQIVVLAIEEVAETVAKAEEELVIAPVVDIEKGHMDVLMIDMEKDLAVLFVKDDDFKNDSEGVDEEEAWEVNEEWLMAPVTPPPVLARQPLIVYEVRGPSTTVAEGPYFPHLAPGLSVPLFVIEDLSTRLGNLEFEHGQLVHKINQVSDVEVAASVTIKELGLRIYDVEGQVQTTAQRDETIAELTQQVQALQIDVQQRDTQIQPLQTMVTKMGSRESTLMWCILGLERQIVAVEKRPPGP
nr:hypothetical protein [Tanacetum cinerariifolium]